MKKIILTSLLIAAASTAQAATINLADNNFDTVTHGFAGPITAFTEVVDGITFTFSATGQFRKVGTWSNGTTQSSAPWALQFGGGGGNTGSFTLTTNADVQLSSFTGFGQQFNTSPIFDVSGTLVSSLGNAFSTSGFLSTATPVVESFAGGSLSLTAGETYSFTTTNASAVTVGYITALNFSTPSQVPVPAAIWLFGSGLLGLIGAARRKYKN